MKLHSKIKFSLIGSFMVFLTFCIGVNADQVAAKEKTQATTESAQEKKTPKSQADAMLDMMVKQGLIPQKVADKTRDEMGKLAPTGEDASKIKIGGWIQEMKFYGDARLRYEFREGQNAVFTSPTAARPGVANAFNSAVFGDSLNRERWRYRLRFGTEAKFIDDFKMGLQLETSSNSRSTNVSFGNDSSAANGFSSKVDDFISVGLLYLEWNPRDWATLTGGRMRNPFMTTTLVWDSDIAPEGAAERFKYKVNDQLELFATLGQFIYDDLNPDNPIASATAISGDDAFLFAQQFGAKYAFNKDTSLTVAPAFYIYGGPGDSFRGRFDGTGAAAAAANDVAINDLLIVQVPMEIKFKLWDQKLKAFSDFAVNAMGADRARHAGRPDKDGAIYAYQMGLGWGEAKKKGDYEAKAFWQHTDLYALDPNMIDSDLFDSKLNLEGFVISGKYNFTDFLSGGLTYAMASRADKDLPTAFTGDIGINPINDYQLLQVDLMWKF